MIGDAMYEVPGSRLREMSDRITELTARAERAEAAIQRVRSLTYNTEGEPLHPDSEIPVGEVCRMLAEFAAPDSTQPDEEF